jgi:hypothetical protein
MVYGTEAGEASLWLRDLITGEEQPLSVASDYWLSSELLLQEIKYEGVRQFQIFDVKAGTQTPLQSVFGIPDTTSRLDDGTLVFSPEVLTWFRQAKKVYYVPAGTLSIAVALASDFKARPQDNYALATPRANGDPSIIIAFLKENAIAYQEIRGQYYYDNPLPSHNGRFVATGAIITDMEGREIVRYGGTSITGWAHDDSGIYFQPPDSSDGPILMPLFRPGKAVPILKLKVPAEYLQKEQTQNISKGISVL